MPGLLIILGIILAVSIWWWRVKVMRDAAGDAIDAAGKLKGTYKRRKFRKAAEISPLETIDDPIIAAGTLVATIAGQGIKLGNREKEVIAATLALITDQKKAKEAAIYGAWAAENIADCNLVITQLCPQLRLQLSMEEKRQLITLVDDARTAMLADHPVYIEPQGYELSFERLKQKLGL